MDAIGPAEIIRILSVTDALGIHRESVQIPLGTAGNGHARIRGRVLEIVAPRDRSFEEWLSALAICVRALDLSPLRQAD